MEYLFYFILGGILFCLLNFFSKVQNTLICGIISALPILFLAGFIFIKNKKSNNIMRYTQISIKTILIYILFLIILFLIILLLFLYKVKNINYCLLFSIMFFLFIYLIFFFFRIL